MDKTNIEYIDEKAKSVKNFDILANLMWRRAQNLLQNVVKTNEQVLVIDPCAGAGKLLSKMNKLWLGKAYEPDHGQFMYAKYFFDQYDYQVSVINEPFEFHFQTPALPEYHLAISIPYTDRNINTSFELDKEYLKIKNYVFYVMARAIDILQDGGIGIFAIPSKMVSQEKFESELEHLLGKGRLLDVEGYGELAIVTFKKEKIKN